MYHNLKFTTMTHTKNIQTAYTRFVKGLMKSTGLPIEEMQTINEWVNNRLNDFNSSTYAERYNGFEIWLLKRY